MREMAGRHGAAPGKSGALAGAPGRGVGSRPWQRGKARGGVRRRRRPGASGAARWSRPARQRRGRRGRCGGGRRAGGGGACKCLRTAAAATEPARARSGPRGPRGGEEAGGQVAGREWRRGAAELMWRPPIGPGEVEGVAGHVRRRGTKCPAARGGVLGFHLREFRRGSHIYR